MARRLSSPCSTKQTIKLHSLNFLIFPELASTMKIQQLLASFADTIKMK